MIKKFRQFAGITLLSVFLIFTSGCNLIALALSAAAAYGMSKVLHH
jgi:hypothetical protein